MRPKTRGKWVNWRNFFFHQVLKKLDDLFPKTLFFKTKNLPKNKSGNNNNHKKFIKKPNHACYIRDHIIITLSVFEVGWSFRNCFWWLLDYDLEIRWGGGQEFCSEYYAWSRLKAKQLQGIIGLFGQRTKKC